MKKGAFLGGLFIISILVTGVSVSARSDQDIQADFERAFSKIEKHTHERVCTMPADGEAGCDARVVTDSTAKPLVSSGPVGFGPTEFHVAYGSQTQASRQKIVAIVDAYDDPNIVSDLSKYSTAFGIPQLPNCPSTITSSATPCFKKTDQRGSTRFPQANAGWSLEIALDVEAAHAMCQNCSILLVEADSSSFSNLLAAEDRAASLGASVISNSWGASEFNSESSATFDSHFNKPGIAITFSAGDSGYGVEYPAASRYVTAVGGTSLAFNTDGSYAGEAAWAGTGSGCSAYESKPSWQADSLCAKRTVADVSADADPSTGAAVYDSVSYSGQKGWFQVGGTSLASPLIAAEYALSGNTAGSANAIPYALHNSINFNDITQGQNGSCGNYLCKAAQGFDGPTGLGSPKNSQAF